MAVLPVTMTVAVIVAMPSVVVMVVKVSGSDRLRTLRVRPVTVRPQIRVLVDTTAVSVSDCLHRAKEDSSLHSGLTPEHWPS